MQAIGIAETEKDVAEQRAQLDIARKHHEYEELDGRKLAKWANLLGISGVWGVNGVRHRILLYKDYSGVSLSHLFAFDKDFRRQLPKKSLWGVGLPSYLLSRILLRDILLPDFIPQSTIKYLPWQRRIPYLLYQNLHPYICLHLELFAVMQRAGLLSPAAGSSWFPSWRFFIPGSHVSPIHIPPIPTSITPTTILDYIIASFVGVAPVVFFYTFSHMYDICHEALTSIIFKRLPYTGPPPQSALEIVFGPEPSAEEAEHARQVEELRAVMLAQAEARALAESATGTAEDHQQPRNGHDIVRDENSEPVVPLAGGGSAQAPPPPPPVDDFGSDDEDEIPSTTLISFDIETTETANAEPAAGFWELRPNPGSSGQGHGGQDGVTSNNNNDEQQSQQQQYPQEQQQQQYPPPVYRHNSLIRLPVEMTADFLAGPLARLILMPLESMTMLSLGRLAAVHQHDPPPAITYGDLWDTVPEAAWRPGSLCFGSRLVQVLAVETVAIWAGWTSVRIIMLLARRMRLGILKRLSRETKVEMETLRERLGVAW